MIRLYGEIAELSELGPQSLDNFYVNVVMEAGNKQPVQVKFNLWQYTGAVEVKFSVCKGDLNTCSTNFTTFDANKTLYEKLHPTHIAGTGSTSIYKLDLNASDFSDTQTDKYKSVTLSVYVVNPYNGTAKYSITYIDHSKVTVLRENHPIKDRIEMGQTKYYKLAAFSEGVLVARVHLNEIAGATRIIGYNIDPRNIDDPNLMPAAIQPITNTLVFDSNLHMPIYVVVFGEDNAFYALTLSVERKAEINPDKNQKDAFNIIVVP
jgi:hypothetical protein